ncbi:MAG: hypothetical protein QOF92_1585 [Pseudonocardiales bacterium]|jgi:signal transduction histidine kinase|nr:hypothetical protein [Pseudonocardiales bacterium]
MDAHPSAALQFPDASKLELDDLIDQLVDRANGVKRSQGRLRALLRAIETVTGDLAIDAVLRNVIEAACELAGARYGALGVIGHDGGLEQFIHVGMDEQTVARIGHLPEGHGLLGALIRRPNPIRLQHMGDDERSTGFPAGHPPMDSFLGVPIRVRGEVFGNLYLTDSAAGEFTAEDEELVGALAMAAGTALSNGRLLDESRLQQRWLAASVEISAQLLAAVGEDPLRMIARRAIEIADADLVTVGLLTPDAAELMIEVASGAGSDELLGQRFSLEKTLAGRAIEERNPLLLSSSDSTSDADERRSHEASVMDAGPLMVLPLEGLQGVRGVLSLVRARGRQPFSGADLAMASGFASHANVALELADARAVEQRLVLVEDRERIARDLHDHVIQELFAIGLGLEAAVTLLGPGEAAAQSVRQRVVDIDRTIRHIRTSIFELRGPLDTSADGTRRRVLDISADLAPALGFSPRVSFSGLIDNLSADLAEDVAAFVREVLTNVAKHARATCVDLDLTLASDQLTLQVIDDGVGYVENGRLSGLANLRTRAELHGGTFKVFAGHRGGTTVIWKAPLL